MNSSHLRHSERALRSHTYVDSQPEEFPEGSKAVLLSAAIKQDLTRLAELDVIRSGSMTRQKQATAARQTAHRLLTNLLNKTINTSELFADGHPDTIGMFGRPQKNANDQTLIADARSIADKAASLVGLFTQNGMATTFVSDMRSYANAIESSIQIQTESAGERMRANAEMKEIIRHLGELVDRLDIVIRNKYSNNPAQIAAWEMARRLEHPARSKRNNDDDEEGDNAPPAPQP
jgi:hypothetical protein